MKIVVEWPGSEGSMALCLLFCAVFVAGCNEKHPRCPPPLTPAATSSNISPSPPSPPLSEAKEGRLVTAHEAVRGRPGTQLEEPLAPTGEWVSVSWGWAWKPLAFNSFPDAWVAIVDEVRVTLANLEHVGGGGLGNHPGPRSITRVVFLFGPTFQVTTRNGAITAAGLYSKALWEEDDGTYSDVMWIGLTDATTRSIAPVGHAYKLRAPATGNELAHQETGILTH